MNLQQYSESWVFKLSLVFFTATLHLHLIGVTWAFCYFMRLNFRVKTIRGKNFKFIWMKNG